MDWVENCKLLQKKFMLEEIKMFNIKKNFYFTKLFKTVPLSSNIATWRVHFNHGGMSTYIDRGGEPNPVGGKTIGEMSQEVSYKKEEYQLDANEIQWRGHPTDIGQNESAEKYIQDAKLELNDRLDARVEWECLNACMGQFSFSTSEGYSRTINYGIPSSNLIDLTEGGGTNVWSDTSVDIVGMLKNWRKLIRGAINPQLVLSPTGMEYLVKNESIKSLLTYEQRQKTLSEGKLSIPIYGITLEVYEGSYLQAHPMKPDGTRLPPDEIQFMNEKEVFLIGQKADSKSLYERGISACVEADGKSQRFSYRDQPRKDRYSIITGEYSLPMLKQPYSIVHAKIAS